jgi:hypothetical protein
MGIDQQKIRRFLELAKESEYVQIKDFCIPEDAVLELDTYIENDSIGGCCCHEGCYSFYIPEPLVYVEIFYKTPQTNKFKQNPSTKIVFTAEIKSQQLGELMTMMIEA